MKLHFLTRWEQKLETGIGKLELFLSDLSGFSNAALDDISGRLDKEVFSEIDCLECANCCKTTPAILIPGDIKRMAKYLKMPPKLFKRKYVLEDINGELSFMQVPCVFLEADNKCKVYDVRPASCRDYPHTGSGNFKKRAGLHKKNLQVCPAAFEIVLRMERKKP